jgi:hypothetical protein
MKVELVEFRANLPDQKLPTDNIPHDPLCNIYNYASLIGPHLVNEAYSRVSYHIKNSPANEEFKIRLPDVLTSRHWIKISVYHVHVKTTHNRASLFSTPIIRQERTSAGSGAGGGAGGSGHGAADNGENTIHNCLGVGFLPLHTAGGALVPDLDHVIPVFPSALMTQNDVSVEIPVLRVRTRSCCSLVSSDKHIQSLIRNIPLPLGYLPSSIMPEAIATQLIFKATSIRPKEEILEANLEELPRASALELSQHFLVIMRALIRALLAGTCVFDEIYANPFKHCKARCRSFLTLLKILDKIIQGVGSGFEDEKEREILEAYIDFVLDEEVPLENVRGGAGDRLSLYVDSLSNIDGQLVDDGVAYNKQNVTASDSMRKSRSGGNEEMLSRRGLGVAGSTGGDKSEVGSGAGNSNKVRSRKNSEPLLPNESEKTGDEEKELTREESDSNSDNDDTLGELISERDYVSNSSQPPSRADSLKPTTSALWTDNDEGDNNDGVPLSPSEVVVTASGEISELDSEGIGMMSKRPSAGSSMNSPHRGYEGDNNNPRKSWGKYITESHWSMGKFVAINELLSSQSRSEEDNENGDDESDAYLESSAYLDKIADHITNQAIRIIEERLIGVAVYAVSSFVRYNTDNDYDPNDLNESSIMDVKQNRYSVRVNGGNVSSHHDFASPFRKYPFLEVPFSKDPKGRYDLTIDDPLVEELVSKSTWVHPILEETTLSIPTTAPLYDSLLGYRERAISAAEVGDGGTSSVLGRHWWPWLYEVITFQWGAVLALILSSMQLISSNNLDSIVGSYQFEYELSQNTDRRDWRTILMEEGPLLLRMIYKSLALRIQRERKRAPVILDDQYFNALENLVMLIAVEASTTVAGLWRSKKIILSLSHFLRSLFALIVSNQVVRLLRSFFKTIRKSRGKNEEVDLRLLMIEELSLFDYFVALNLPYTLDAPITCFSFSLVDSLAIINPAFNSFSPVGLRYESSQPPYALLHMFIGEIMFSCRQDYRKREKAWEILRDLVVRHSFDARYQNKEDQQRISCMYLPLIHEITAEVNHLSALKHNCSERREALSILLYILGGTPVRILRSHIRAISIKAFEEISEESTKGSEMVNNPSTNIASPLSPSSTVNNNSNNNNDYESSAFIARARFGNGFISDFLRILHLVIDTFEIPYYLNSGSSNVTNASITSSLGHLNPMGGVTNRDESFLKLLSPSVTLDATVNSPDSLSSSFRKISVAESISGIPTQQRQSSLLANLTNLDQRMQYRKTSSIASRKSNTSTTNNERERVWIEHARKVATVASERDRSVIIRPVSREDAQYCAEKFSASATKSMLSIMWVILEECPKIIIEHQSVDAVSNANNDATNSGNENGMSEHNTSGRNSSSSSSSSNSVASSAANAPLVPLRQQYIEPSICCNEDEKELVMFMRQALCVPLHALYCNQVDSALAEIYSFISSIVKRFGAKIFLASLEDSLQYWLRITLIHFASVSLLVRHTACNFFITLLDSTFQYFGTFAAISTVVFAIFNDVLSEILEWNKSTITTLSDEDSALQGLIDAFLEIKENVQKNLNKGSDGSSSKKSSVSSSSYHYPSKYIHPMSIALLEFVKNVEVIFRANAEVRRYLSLPAGYDFFGANLLDGPYDERTSLLLQVLRQNRRNIKNDLNDSNKTSVGFQLEEVMMHFVEAADVYDVYKLPRFKMQWLENLARLHQSRANRAEGAEIRWKIYLLCSQLEDRWQSIWSPKPPLQWQRRGKIGSGSDPSSSSSSLTGAELDGRDFYRVLLQTLNSTPLRPWMDMNQFWIHKVTSLTVSRQWYASVNLMSLAERASTQLIQMFRSSQQTGALIEEYTVLANNWKLTLEKGITNEIALGTFYRVYYTGQACPTHLREKEFIFRNANHLHVSEFHALVISHLKSVVLDGVEVKIIQDNLSSIAEITANNPKCALIVMNSVKPVRAITSSHLNSYRLISSNEKPLTLGRSSSSSGSSYSSNEGDKDDSTNGPNSISSCLGSYSSNMMRFQYSVPFTQDGGKAHAKKMEDQWTKYTVLTVRETFPYILTRQQVVFRDVTVLSPIEVSIHDIEERIDSMEKELEFNPKTQSDNNNMMRIVQGTVLPQVRLLWSF